MREKERRHGVTLTDHVAVTGCGLTFEDFAGEDDERCADGGLPNEHPKGD